MAYIGKTNWTNNEIVEAADLNRIEQGIENSVEKVAGKGLSTNDYTTAEKNKLAGIAAQATKNDTDANLRNRATHTGTQSADTIIDGTTNKVFTATEKTKLAGIATGATKNSTDATLLSRANHTGTQSADTITDGTTNKVFTAAEKTKLANIENGANKYTHPATHPASMITGLPTSLPANGGNADTVGGFTVGVNVPANAKFTDTTYSEISTAEIDAGASSTRRTITGRRIKYILDKVQAWLDNKVDKVSGKGLSTNDYTTAEKNKLDGIEAGAQVNTVTSVAGKTGAVTLSKSDVGLGNVDNVKQMPISGGTFTGVLKSNTPASADMTATSPNTIEIMGDASKPAVMTFHRASTYAVNFGIDTDNELKLGGWSAGSNKYKIWSEKNLPYARNIHISTSDPSGGSNGDVWLKYTP
jgi:hypothetical protein